MKILLIGKGLWEIIEDVYAELEDWNSLEGEERRLKKSRNNTKIRKLLFSIRLKS